MKHNLYKLREERDMKPSTFGELVSSMLYEKRFALVTAARLCPLDKLGTRQRQLIHVHHALPQPLPACVNEPVFRLLHRCIFHGVLAFKILLLLRSPLTTRLAMFDVDFTRRFGPYFVSPVVAGLEPQKDGSWTPFLCGTDSIGAIEKAHDFMLAGTAPESLYGMCESMWRPDLVSTRLEKRWPCTACDAHHILL